MNNRSLVDQWHKEIGHHLIGYTSNDRILLFLQWAESNGFTLAKSHMKIIETSVYASGSKGTRASGSKSGSK